MKIEIPNNKEGYGKKYKYVCDRCKKEISYKEKTLHKLIDQYDRSKSKKACDLCDKCYLAFLKGVFKGGNK
jgi:hypothetical protein